MFIILFVSNLIVSSARFFSKSRIRHCNECRFFIESVDYKGSPDSGIYGKCSLFPKNHNNDDNIHYLVTGQQKESENDFMYCSTIRNYDDMCGETGKMFKLIKKNKNASNVKNDEL